MVTTPGPTIELHDTREAASIEAADALRTALKRRLQPSGSVSLVVSGGTTPVRCFELLARADLDWPRVQVLPSDERGVAPDHSDSNARMLREHLFVGPAAAAELITLEDTAQVRGRIPRLQPFAVVLLGVGEDGHFASLFADADNLAAGLDPDAEANILPVRTASSPYRRTTLTLSCLMRTDLIVLLAFGAAKRRALEAPDGLPVAHVLAQRRAPLRVIWAP